MKKYIHPIILITTAIILICTSVFAKTSINHTNYPAQIKITGTVVNVRSGPSTLFTKVGSAYKNQIIKCFGKMGAWYIVQLENDTVGLVSGDFASPYYGTIPSTSSAPSTSDKTSSPTPAPSAASLTADEKQMFDLVNAERSKNGLPLYSINMDLVKVARTKASDMVTNKYFSHTSPTYGSPFDMMKKFGITYRAAGENLAQNSTVSGAHTSLMNSSGHRANILHSSFNQIGIGIVSGPGSSKTFVQMFIQK